MQVYVVVKLFNKIFEFTLVIHQSTLLNITSLKNLSELIILLTHYFDVLLHLNHILPHYLLFIVSTVIGLSKRVQFVFLHSFEFALIVQQLAFPFP